MNICLKGKITDFQKTSAEDVYWYVILYRGIYGIGGIPDDYDMSMAYKTTLTKKKIIKKHYEDIVIKKNKKFRTRKNDFNYDVPRIICKKKNV